MKMTQFISSNPKTKRYNRISVYYEPEEGKEGDLSEIGVDSDSKIGLRWVTLS